MTRPPAVALVEDEALVRETIVFGLEEAGFAVIALSTPGAALDLLSSDGCDIDGLVTNIDLHASIDGFELARRAVAKRPHLKVLYVSGGAEDQGPAAMVPGGRFLPKPFLPDALVRELSDTLAGAQALPGDGHSATSASAAGA